jgi:hypothetical protein
MITEKAFRYSTYTSCLALIFQSIYFKNAFVKCNTLLIGKIGDSTTGEVWWNWFTLRNGASSLLSYKHDWFSYPSGEPFFRLASAMQIIRRLLNYALTLVVGPICAVNLFIIIGFLLNTFIFSYLMIKFYRVRYIPSMVGSLLFSFNSFTLTQMDYHPIFVHIWVLPLYLIIYNKYKSRAKKSIILLSLFFSTLFYIEPYFPFILLPLHIFYMTRLVYSIQKKNQEKYFFYFKVLTLKILSLSPLVIFAVLFDKEGIPFRASNDIYNYRPHVLYLFKYNPDAIFYFDIPTYFQLKNDTGVESNFGILYLLISLSIALLFIFIKLRPIKFNFLKISFISFLIIGLILISYSNSIQDLYVYLFSPISFWRVSSRLLILVLFIFLIYFSIVFNKFLNLMTFRKVIDLLVFNVFFLFILVHCFASLNFNANYFSYSNVPSIYSYINSKLDKNAVIADLFAGENDPILHTFQIIHERRLVNNLLNITAFTNARFILDPQTIPLLRKLGAEYAVIHTESKFEIPQYLTQDISILYSEKYDDVYFVSQKKEFHTLIRILPGKEKTDFISLISGFYNYDRGLMSGMWTSNRKSCFMTEVKNKKEPQKNIVFGASSFIPFQSFTAIQDGVILKRATVSQVQNEFRLKVKSNKEICFVTDKFDSINRPVDMRLGGMFITGLRIE